MTANNILGKIGEKVGTELKALEDSLEGQIDSINLNNITGGLAVTKADGNGVHPTNLGISTDGRVSISGNVSLGANLTALGSLTALRAETSLDVTVGTTLAVGGHANLSSVSLAGSLSGQTANFLGKLTAGELEVKGDTKVINTQTVEVSDNILELNKSSDGSTTATQSGIEINRGESTSGGQAFVDASGTVKINPTTSSTSFDIGPENFILIIPEALMTNGTRSVYFTFAGWNDGQPYYGGYDQSAGLNNWRLYWQENIDEELTNVAGGWIVHKQYGGNFSETFAIHVCDVNDGSGNKDVCVPWSTNDTLQTGEVMPLPLAQTTQGSGESMTGHLGSTVQGYGQVNTITADCSTNSSSYSASGTESASIDSVVYPQLSLSSGDADVDENAIAGGVNALWDYAHNIGGFFSKSNAFGVTDDTNPNSVIHRGDLTSFKLKVDALNLFDFGGSPLALTEYETLFAGESYDKFLVLGDIATGNYFNASNAGGDYSGMSSDFLWVLGVLGNDEYSLQFILQDSGSLYIEEVANINANLIGYTSSNGSESGAMNPASAISITEPTAYQAGGTNTDKAKFLWDNAVDQLKFKFMLGDDLADLIADDVVVETVTVPDGDGVVINTTPLGDYAQFETAFNTATA